MQVGCYVLDLYCDDHGHCATGSVVQYTGETGPECRQQARKDGWKLGRAGESNDTCPRCVKRKSLSSDGS